MPPKIIPQNSQEQLDPTVVALTKSIGKAETGGKYDAIGDGGKSQGAYQFTPGFLQEWAPKAGVQYQPGAQFTPEQQDKIAYNAVKIMGTMGDPAYPHLGKLTPAQITSAWNTGDPNAYLDPEYGKNNSYGSTQNYVNEVAKNYEGYTKTPITPKTQENVSPIKSSSQPDILTLLEGLGGGALAWLAGSAKPFVKPALTDIGAGLGAAGGTLIEPGGGTVVGGAAGATVGSQIADALGFGDNKTSTVQSTPTPSQPQPLDTSFLQSTQSSDKLKSAIIQSLQGTQGGRLLTKDKNGQEAINTASTFGLIRPDEKGNLVFDEEKRKQAATEIGSLQDQIIAKDGGHASPLSVSNYAGQYIGKDRFSTDLDRQQAAKIVAKNLKATRINPNEQMSLTDMRERQKQHYAAAKPAYGKTLTTPEMLAHKALGNAYGAVIRANMKDPELYDRTKKMEQDLINVKLVGKQLGGKKAPQNKGIWESFLRQGARAAEIYIGDRLGGPIGAVIGGLAGEQFNRKIDQKFGRNIFETPGMKAALDILHDTKPQAYTQLVDALKNQGVNIENEEIGGKRGLTPEELLKRKGKPTSIIDMDKLVNEIKQDKPGLIGLA